MDEDTEVALGKNKINIHIRDIIYFLGLLFSVIGIYFAANSRIERGQMERADLYKKYDDLLVIIKSMDQTGTKRSHETDSTQQSQIENNTPMINDINRVVRDLTPKVDKIDTNVLWLMSKQAEARKWNGQYYLHFCWWVAR